jgi:TetR/AcrR family transcriptional regulator, transcriptional repressor for nem operon
MARSKSYSTDSLLESALGQFWNAGFYASSIDDLVTATGTSRRALYGGFGSKEGLFLACFPQYQASVVDPAFARVEQSGATLSNVESYFEHQIAGAEAAGLPGPGCFVANAATEVAPHNESVRDLVQAHNARLKRGFANALSNSCAEPLPADALDGLAMTIVLFANGLWSASRVIENGDELRTVAADFIKLIKGRLDHAAQ